MKKLTPKQETFCKEYLVDLNATQACIRAGYSSKTAMEQGYQLLQKTSVQNYLSSLMAKRSERLKASADQVFEELVRIAFFDIKKAFDQNGILRQLDHLPQEVVAAIASLETLEVHERAANLRPVVQLKKLKFYDKLRALELLGKHLGLFKNEAPIQNRITLEDLVLASMETEK